MHRTLFQLSLFAGSEAAFDDRNRTPPAHLRQAFGDAGLRNITAFRRGSAVWCYSEASGERGGLPGADRALDRLVSSPSWTRWLKDLADVIESGEEGNITPYHEVFHSHGPALATPSERGLFVLVVHPERIAQYDARHADPWPEMVAALEESGFRNYSGFRLGSQVAYYGEFHPDMATALATIGATEVNRRWGESFHGIITSITDEEGHLFVAREVFHLA